MLIQGNARYLPLADTSVDCVITSPPYFGLRSYLSDGDPRKAQEIGLERTPEAYVATLVEVFSDVRRVLKNTGTVWLNLASSYAGGGRGGGGSFMAERREASWHKRSTLNGWRRSPPRWKAKDLIPIPWLVALALQQQGWYLRSEIIWYKPNSMPSSVHDRPTIAHETVLLLTKQRRYYYDAQAIAEPVSEAMVKQIEQGYHGEGLKKYAAAGMQNPSTVKARILARARDRWDRKRKEPDRRCSQHRETRDPNGPYVTRNKRSVWTIPTQSYRDGDHFATMPEALVEPCLLAGTPLGGLVLDPFCGTFTVGAVAARCGRRSIGIELNAAYQTLARRRTAQRGLRY